jgi:hypothetical protein
MDSGTERIAEDLKAIVQTRMAMAEKLGAIEQHVSSTMHHARTTMTQVAEKTTSSVRDTMQVTQDALDPHVHAARHPWAFVGGALILGYAGGALFRRGWRSTTGAVPYYPPGVGGAGVMPTSGSSSSEQRRESGVYPFYPHQGEDHGSGNQGQADRPAVWAEMERALHDELGVVRNGVIRFGGGLLRQMIRQAVPALVQIIGGTRHEQDPRPRAPGTNSQARDNSGA